MLFFVVYLIVSGGSEHAFDTVFTSRNTFLPFWEKSRFGIDFDLVLTPVFGQFSPKWERKAFQNTSLKTPPKKTPKKTSK